MATQGQDQSQKGRDTSADRKTTEQQRAPHYPPGSIEAEYLSAFAGDSVEMKAVREHLDEILRWVRYGMRHATKSGHLIGSHRDVIQSAVASFLRDRREANTGPDEPVEEVWEALRNHLNRKIDTWSKRPRNKKERFRVQESDISDPVAAAQWMGSFNGHELTPEDAAIIEEALSLLEEIEDPVMREVANLRRQGYNQTQIAELMEIGPHRVSQAIAHLKIWFRNRGLL